MILIGMLDSPFVRRTAIGLHCLGLPFEHRSLSVFRDFEAFRELNPFVKAPTLILSDEHYLVDSSLILQYAERKSPNSLYSESDALFEIEQQIIGTASIANEKTVQIVYEFEIRPSDKRHTPWLERISGQVSQAFEALEHLVKQHPQLFNEAQLTHAAIAAAVAWTFTQRMRPGLIAPDGYPALVNWTHRAEQTEPFQTFPYDDSMSDDTPWAPKAD